MFGYQMVMSLRLLITMMAVFESTQYSGSCTVWYVVNPHTGNLSRRCSLSEETRLALAWEQHKRKK